MFTFTRGGRSYVPRMVDSAHSIKPREGHLSANPRGRSRPPSAPPPAISRDERHPFEYRRIGSSAPLQSTNRTSGGGQSSVPAPSSGVADGRSPWSRVTREMHSGKLLCTSFSGEPLDGTIMT